MGMREKLIELLRGVIKFHEEQNEKWILGGKVGERPSITESFVDVLIANGVTIPVRCKDCWKSGEGLCSYQFKNVPGKDFCGDGERRTDDE